MEYEIKKCNWIWTKFIRWRIIKDEVIKSRKKDNNNLILYNIFWALFKGVAKKIYLLYKKYKEIQAYTQI